MKIFKKIISLLLVFCAAACCLFTVSACKKNTAEPPKTETPETNPLYSFDEIREFNYNSKIPYIMGSTAGEIGKDFDLVSGTLNHCESYRSKEQKDVIYTLSRIEILSEKEEAASPVYVTGVTVMPEDKKITSLCN